VRLEPPAGRSANHFEILISVSHFAGGSPNKLITILACLGNPTGGVIMNALASFWHANFCQTGTARRFKFIAKLSIANAER
jgi:hypothetical protein